MTAAALNAEFNNVLNNPLTLISPTTGNINFNSNQATNFGLEILGADPASVTSGRVVYQNVKKIVEVDDGTIIRAIPAVPSTNVVVGDLIVSATSASGAWKVLPVGTTGQLLSITSTGVLGWVAPSAATTQAVVKTSEGGTSLDISASAVGSLIVTGSSGAGGWRTLAVGTTGQILTLTSVGGGLGWVANVTAGGAGAVFSSQQTWTETGIFDPITLPSSGTFVDRSFTRSYPYAASSSGNVWTASTHIGTPLSWPVTAISGNIYLHLENPPSVNPSLVFFTSLNPDMTCMIIPQLTTGTSTARIGMSAQLLSSADATNGLYFRYSANSTIFAVSRNAGTSFTITTTGVATSSFASVILRIQVTSSNANVYVGGLLQGTFTSSQIPAVGTGLGWVLGQTGAFSSQIVVQGWQIIQDRAVV